MRISVDLSDEEVRLLDDLARRTGRSRSTEIRDAITKHIRANADDDWLDAAFGLWAREGIAEDGLAYERRLRDEWTRENESS